MPVSLVLITLLLAFIFFWARRRLATLVCLLVAILVLWVSSLPVVANRLLVGLIQQFPPTAIESIPEADCILLLGGAVPANHHPAVDVELTDSSDRVYQAARLFREGKSNHIIVLAGNQPWAKDLPPEASRIERLLLEWGVPKDVIYLETDSKNTRENAVNSKALVSAVGCVTSLLITSAWHMPRAKATFEKIGIKVVPVSVDVRFVPEASGYLGQLIPTAEALAATSLAIRQWMGIWVYRWREWS